MRAGGSCLAVALLIVASSAPAQQPLPSPPPTSPVFKAEVAVVAVPVFVTDGSGRAVPGLEAGDFEVYDGGRRVPIVAFQAIDVDALSAPAASTAAPLPLAVQAAAARQFLLLFDLQFSSPAGILRARKAATRFVRESLAATDLVAVATFGRPGLKMLTGFTTDRAYVERAILALGVVPNLELVSDPLGLGTTTFPEAGSPGTAGDRASQADREIADQMNLLADAARRDYQSRLRDLYASLVDLANALSPLRGRKQVVMLSGGHAQRAWTGIGLGASPIEAHAQFRQDLSTAAALRDQMQRIFRAAGASDVAIHAIDLRGIEDPVDVTSQTARNADRGEGRLALAALADNTGGRLIRPTNDFGRALHEVDEASRHYYVLAFQPADPAPRAGGSRAVKVRVNRDGVHVSHRATYVTPSAPTDDEAGRVQLAAAEAIAKGLSGGPLKLGLVAMPYGHRDGGASVPAVLHVDGPGLVDAAEGKPLTVQVYGYALGDGRVLDNVVFQTTFDSAKRRGPARASGLTLLTVFAAPAGRVDVRFFVRASGATGSIRKELEVPAFGEGDTIVAAVMPTIPVGESVVAPVETRVRPPVEIPFRVGGAPFLPGTALRPGMPSQVCAFVWRPSRASRSAPPLAVTAETLRTGAAPRPLHIEGGPRVVPDADGFERYLLTLVPPDTDEGEYTVRLTFRDPDTGWAGTSDLAVAIRE